MKPCVQCHHFFEILDPDRRVLQKFDAPEPKLCPDCRMQRRTAFRCEMSFHRATCELTRKRILTNIPPERGYKVMASEKWHSDEWDPLNYGRDFDFGRPFFEQMNELIQAVPHINIMRNNSENCEYCNYVADGKDCYYSARVANSEQAYYSYLPVKCFRVFDGYYLREGQECYQAVDCSECFAVTFSQRLKTCRNVHFSLDCVGCEHCFGCRDCFGCVGLKHKQFCILNKQYSQAEYRALKAKIVEHMKRTGEYGEFFPMTLSVRLRTTKPWRRSFFLAPRGGGKTRFILV